MSGGRGNNRGGQAVQAERGQRGSSDSDSASSTITALQRTKAPQLGLGLCDRGYGAWRLQEKSQPGLKQEGSANVR